MISEGSAAYILVSSELTTKMRSALNLRPHRRLGPSTRPQRVQPPDRVPFCGKWINGINALSVQQQSTKSGIVAGVGPGIAQSKGNKNATVKAKQLRLSRTGICIPDVVYLRSCFIPTFRIISSVSPPAALSKLLRRLSGRRQDDGLKSMALVVGCCAVPMAF